MLANFCLFLVGSGVPTPRFSLLRIIVCQPGAFPLLRLGLPSCSASPACLTSSLPRPAELLLGILCCPHLSTISSCLPLSPFCRPELLFLLLKEQIMPRGTTNHIAFLPLRTLTHAASHTLRLLGWCFKLMASFTIVLTFIKNN
jgi:hypothetical protein